jgi:NAD(P)-dependent dehydrogenase (short-subunit alcohol dehydrogenase family)
VWAPADYGELETLASSWTPPHLDGVVALVTGAAVGIGKATALRLSSAAARVVICDVDEERGSDTAEEVPGGVFVHVDVSEADQLRAAFDEAGALGRLGVVVNNAGGTPAPHFPDADPEHWTRTFAVNLGAAALGTHLAIEAMRGSGGAIVNVSSVAGLGWMPYPSPEYAASKAAVNRLTSSLGGLEAEGIRVNAICPDWVATEAIVAAQALTPLAEWDGPEELVPLEAIADAILRLACDESLAGRVLVCPAGDRPWGLVPLTATP